MPRFVRHPEFRNYLIGTDGRVFSLIDTHGCKRAKPKELKQTPDRKGYSRVTLYKDKIGYVTHVHVLVLRAHRGPCPEGKEGCHKDGKPENNRIGNLRWGTRTSNQVDRVRHGTSNRGERCGRAVLTETNVKEIRKAKHLTHAEIARKFKVHRNTVRQIRYRLTWKHI